MKHVTYGDKSVLVGDRAADLLVEYAAAIARRGDADHVTLSALGPDGHDVEVTFLLNVGATLVIETANTKQPEPENSAAEADMRRKLELLENPPSAKPVEPASGFDQLD